MYSLSSAQTAQISGGTLQDDIVDEAFATTYYFFWWETKAALRDAWTYSIPAGIVAGYVASATGAPASIAALWGLAVGTAVFELTYHYSSAHAWNVF